jgi:glycosyltransferase involved in cell wall biosynthesis
VLLVIAGRVFDQESEIKIRAHAEADSSILFQPVFIHDSEVQHYFNAADVVLLPYKHVLTSGAALLSVSFERPVIAPRSGLIPELVEEGRHGYLFDDYDGMLALMRQVVADERKDSKVWARNFNFVDLNAKLRWPLLTAHPAFGRMLSAMPVSTN